MIRTLLSSLLTALMVVSTACTSTTEILTEPSGAKVYADGNMLGISPVTYSDTKVIGATTTISIKKAGCEDTTAVLTRSEEFQVGPCIGGVFVLVPFLWVMGYRPMHTYHMDCKGKEKGKDDEED